MMDTATAHLLRFAELRQFRLEARRERSACVCESGETKPSTGYDDGQNYREGPCWFVFQDDPESFEAEACDKCKLSKQLTERIWGLAVQENAAWKAYRGAIKTKPIPAPDGGRA